VSKKLFIIGKRSNLSRELGEQLDNAEIISGDELHHLPELLAKTDGSNLVYNLYYKSTWLGRRDTPEAYARYAFQRLAEFTSICRDAQQYVDKVIFTSSSAVYGNNTCASESDRCDITNLYASLKFASEIFLREHLADTRTDIVIARIFNMYGGNDEFSAVSKIANAVAHGAEFSLVNHGCAMRDFVHVRDVVEIYRRLLESQFSGVVNVGSGKGLSVNEVIEKAETAFRRHLQIAHIQRNEINYSVACIDTLIKVIGPMEFMSIDQFYQEQCLTH
jgi:UDP-glucose 4-epimerase